MISNQTYCPNGTLLPQQLAKLIFFIFALERKVVIYKQTIEEYIRSLSYPVNIPPFRNVLKMFK